MMFTFLNFQSNPVSNVNTVIQGSHQPGKSGKIWKIKLISESQWTFLFVSPNSQGTLKKKKKKKMLIDTIIISYFLQNAKNGQGNLCPGQGKSGILFQIFGVKTQ